MFGFKKRRRDRIQKRDMPVEWVRILEEKVALYRNLPIDKRKLLHGYIQIFLDEKKFEGCGGLRITDTIRLTIAAQACILIIGGISDYYPTLFTILVYPKTYQAPLKVIADNGIVTEGYESRQGEAWDMGSMVLTWEIIKTESKKMDGNNLVLHEFAHLLDSELGATESWHISGKDSVYTRWSSVLNHEYEELIKKTKSGELALFDIYGASSLEEFFAVATESFFEKATEMKKMHPILFDQMKVFYRLDPLLLRKG